MCDCMSEEQLEEFLKETMPDCYSRSLRPPPPPPPSSPAETSRKRKFEEKNICHTPSANDWKIDWTAWKSKEYRCVHSENFRLWMQDVKLQKEKKYSEIRYQISNHRNLLKRVTQSRPTQCGDLEIAARQKLREILREPIEILEDLKEDLDAFKYFSKYGTFRGF